MNYDPRREYRWLVHDERYHATLWDCHGYISHRVDGKVRGQSSITSISYRVYILHVERRLPNYLFYLWYYVQYDLLADWQANRIGFHLKGSIGRKGKKKENLFLFQLSIWKLDTRCTLFLLSITIAKRRRRWRRHFFTVDGRQTRCCCRKSLETTLEDGRALFRPIWNSCISAIPEKLYRENSVDHGDPAAFFQPKRSASLEGMCWLTALDINT